MILAGLPSFSLRCARHRSHAGLDVDQESQKQG